MSIIWKKSGVIYAASSVYPCNFDLKYGDSDVITSKSCITLAPGFNVIKIFLA